MRTRPRMMISNRVKSEFQANISLESTSRQQSFPGAIEHLQQVDQGPEHQTLPMMADQPAPHLSELIDDIPDLSRMARMPSWQRWLG